MAVSIKEIETGRDKDQFIKFPWKVFHDTPAWVPPLLIDRRDFLNPAKNPFFDHAKVGLFVAQDERGEILGRIAGIVNHNHNKAHKDQTGFFGLFDCLNHLEASRNLFDAAASFLRAQGMTIMRGPVNMSVNDDCGLLVDGFNTPPSVMMPYNLPYYENLVEDYGFRKVKDLYAYWGECKDGKIPDRAKRGAEIAKKRHGFTVRKIDMKRFNEEVAKIHSIYNLAWEENWGAIGMTDREFTHLARDLKMVVDPDLCYIAEVGGKPAGFSLALPDINQALIHLNGKLLPLGLFKLLWHKRKIDAMRIITMGVIKEYRKMGIDSVFYHETYENGLAKGITKGEMSWILEDNAPMNNVLSNLGFRVHKTYRLYDYSL